MLFFSVPGIDINIKYENDYIALIIASENYHNIPFVIEIIEINAKV